MKIFGKLLLIILLFSAKQAWEQESHLYFDGSNDFVETNNTNLDYTWGDFTFEAVIKGREEEQGTDPTILSNRWSHIKGNTFYLKDVGPGPRVLCFSHGGDEYWIPNNGTYAGSLLDGACHHVAVVKADEDIFFYADGVLFGELIDPYYYCDHLEGYNSVWIGREHPLVGYGLTGSREFKGVIGNARIWNTARTEAEIFDHMYSSMEGSEPGLIGSWELNEGDGQIIYEDAAYAWSGYLGLNSDIDGDGYDPDWFPGGYCTSFSDYGDGEDDGWVDDDDDDQDGDDQPDDGTVSVHQNSAEDLAIYPNPVTDKNLTVNFYKEVDNVKITVYSVSGQALIQDDFSTSGNRVIVDVEALTEGIYMIQLEYDNYIVTEKIAVN